MEGKGGNGDISPAFILMFSWFMKGILGNSTDGRINFVKGVQINSISEQSLPSALPSSNIFTSILNLIHSSHTHKHFHQLNSATALSNNLALLAYEN